MTRNRRLLPVVIWTLAVSSALPAQSPAPSNPLRDFPSGDFQPLQLASRGRNAKLAARRLIDAPEAPETSRLLLGRNRIDDALQSARRSLAGGDVQRTLSVLAVINEGLTSITSDATRDYANTLRTILTPVRSRLTQLPREDAARVARALMGIDNQLERGGSAGWPARVSAFLREYPGTETALLTEVDAIDDVRVNLPARIDALEQF
jgi:hypothetical protein